MKVYIYSQTEISEPDWKHEVNNLYWLIDKITYMPDNDIMAFSVQDLKKLIGYKTEFESDCSLK